MTPIRLLEGVAVAPGLAMGPLHVISSQRAATTVWTVPAERIPGEIGRLADAVTAAMERLKRIEEVVKVEAGENDAAIFAVHRAYLQDPTVLREVEKTIREQRVNAEKAVQDLIDLYAEKLGRLDGAGARSLVSDVSDPWLRVLDALVQSEHDEILGSAERVVLAAAELTPQVVTFLPRNRVLGIVTETGGRFSHGAVLARSFGFPTVTRLPNLLSRLEQGMQITVDGDRGEVRIQPTASDVREFDERMVHRSAWRETLSAGAALPAETPDGETFDVRVNIESVRDLDTFPIEHTDGVGLLRTEFLCMERSQFPSEEEQYVMYRRVLERTAPRPVTFRTLDIGGDKQLPYFRTPPEPNPALGWRGLRISLEWQDLLVVQLRGILRASAHGNARVLLPMVTSLEEVLAVHEIFDGVRRSLEKHGHALADDIPVGIMVEVPSAVIALEHLIEHIDFVSVGTNDLVQYILACDRDNPWVSQLYDPHHPAVLLALEQVARVAAAAGRPRSVCGDFAGDSAVSVLLLGLGYDSVSVAPSFVPEIKYAVRRTTLQLAREEAREALAQKTSDDVRRVLARIRARLYDQRT